MLKRLLAHPLTRGLDLDDPRVTQLRARIIREKGFLRKLYLEWYSLLLAAVPGGPGRIVELGSGAGFLKDCLPEAITSEVLSLPGVDVRLDARDLPFAQGGLKAILMVDVFHHIPDVAAFLSEAQRCLHPGGVLAMIEPWVTPWSRLVYARLHHEPFDPHAPNWRLPDAGPLTGANSALPWIVFERDKHYFTRRYRRLSLSCVKPGFPFTYLLSGGISLRSLAPGRCYGLCRGLERACGPLERGLACFAFIVVSRR